MAAEAEAVVRGVRTTRVEQHGTVKGYRQHKALGSMLCQPCIDAWNTYCAEVWRRIYDPAKRRARYLASKAGPPA